jgi:hypothetical protein
MNLVRLKLEHPNILETPLPPNKFPIYFSKGLSKPRYKDLKFIPYTSTKDLQLKCWNNSNES